MTLKSIYCTSLDELLSRIRQPNPAELYIFIPEGFKLKFGAEQKIFKIFEHERNCLVYGDIEIRRNNKIIQQFYPSYDSQLNLAIMSPIFINTLHPININGSLQEVFNLLLKHIFALHIPDILFEWQI